MPQAVDAHRSPQQQERKHTLAHNVPSQDASFANIFVRVGGTVVDRADKPENISDQVEKELNGSGQVRVGEIASDELKAPAARRNETGTVKNSNPSKSGGQHSDTQLDPRTGRQETVQASASGPSAPPKSTLKPDARQPSNEPEHAAKKTGQQAQHGKLNPTPDAARGVEQAARTGGNHLAGRPSVQPQGKSTASITEVASARRASLSRLGNRQKPQVFRATKEQIPAQVSRALAKVLSNGGGKTVLRLNPQALGEVRIEVLLNRGHARARIHAQTEPARELLASRLDTLEAAMERRGVHVERIEVVGPDAQANSLGNQMDDGGDPASRSAGRGHGGGRAGKNLKGSAESDRNDPADAEHGGSELLQPPIRMDAFGVMRLDALA